MKKFCNFSHVNNTFVLDILIASFIKIIKTFTLMLLQFEILFSLPKDNSQLQSNFFVYYTPIKDCWQKNSLKLLWDALLAYQGRLLTVGIFGTAFSLVLKIWGFGENWKIAYLWVAFCVPKWEVICYVLCSLISMSGEDLPQTPLEN